MKRSLALIALVGLLATSPAAQASSTPRFGQVLMSAAHWSGGVDVRSDSLVGCPRKAHGECAVASYTRSPSGRLIRTGLQYDAVELALRVMVARGWITKALPAVSQPSKLYSAAPAAVLDHHPVTRGYTPVPGDIIVWSNTQPHTGGRGQVAVVDRVSAGIVRYVQQGAASPVGTLVLGRPDVRHVIGYLHARANTMTIPGTQTPAPNAVGDESLTSFADAGGALQLFVLTSTGVLHEQQLPGQRWTSEVVASGRFRRVAAFSNGSSLELFAISRQGVERFTRTAGAWLPGQLVTAGRFTEIAALAEAGGAEDLFTLSASGLRHDRLQPGASWVDEPVARGVFTQISAVQDPATGLLHLFAIDGFGIDDLVDRLGTPWVREVIATGDFTQIVALSGEHELVLDALDADGVNQYGEYLAGGGWNGRAATGHGRFSQIGAVVDATGQPRVFALLSKGVLDSGSTLGSDGLPSVAGSFSQLSVAAGPTAAMQVFAISHGGIEHATSADGATWVTENLAG